MLFWKAAKVGKILSERGSFALRGVFKLRGVSRDGRKECNEHNVGKGHKGCIRCFIVFLVSLCETKREDSCELRTIQGFAVGHL